MLGGNFQMLGFTLRAIDNNRIGILEARGTLNSVNLIFLEQEGDAVGIGFDDAILERHHLIELQTDLIQSDADVFEMSDWLRQISPDVFKIALDGDTANVGRQVPPSVSRFSMQATLKPKLRGTDRTDITARARADNKNVVRSVSHG